MNYRRLVLVVTLVGCTAFGRMVKKLERAVILSTRTAAPMGSDGAPRRETESNAIHGLDSPLIQAIAFATVFPLTANLRAIAA